MFSFKNATQLHLFFRTRYAIHESESTKLMKKLPILKTILIFAAAISALSSAKTFAQTLPHPKKVLFICTGNYYRSRYAEAYFNYQVDQQNEQSKWKATSRGLAPNSNNRGNISSYAVDELKNKKIPESYFDGKPTSITAEDVNSADLIILLNQEEHEAPFNQRFPGVDPKKIKMWHVGDVDRMKPSFALPLITHSVDALLEGLFK